MDITYIPFTFPTVPSVRCLFQTRSGGHAHGAYGGGNISLVTGDVRDHVLANRKSLTAHIACPFSELSQVHGDALLFEPTPTPVEGSPQGKGLPSADGQATDQKNLALMIKTADCQPILFAHKEGKHIMALHVGWRGNRLGFIGSAVARFCAHYNLAPHDLMAVRGPSLGPAVAEFVHFDKEWGESYAPWYDAKEKTLNLWALTRHQLQEAGLREKYIFGIDLCTLSMPELFFSYRHLPDSGRQASLIWRTA